MEGIGINLPLLIVFVINFIILFVLLSICFIQAGAQDA